jgi:ubiquinone/menaquinone biosynthesis C-methylase UbiE
MNSSTASRADLAAIKAGEQQAWAAGDFSRFATTIVIVSERLCEAVDLRAGQRVLDVATGSGNTAIAAARRFCDVTGLDYVDGLMDRGRERAAAERLNVEFVHGDAEDLPFPADSFDVVLSTFGAMFAPDQERTAAEMVRVVRPGGKIGMSNFTPKSLAGGFSLTAARYAMPPRGVKPPMLWGTEERLHDLFGNALTDLSVRRREVMLRYRSLEHWLDFFTTYFGPIHEIYEQLDEQRRESFGEDLKQVVAGANRADDGTVVAPIEYAEVVITLTNGDPP